MGVTTYASSSGGPGLAGPPHDGEDVWTGNLRVNQMLMLKGKRGGKGGYFRHAHLGLQ